MSEPQSSWAFVGISPEARQAAEAAAEAAGMELDTWLAQLIKYKSTMELKGRAAVPLDAAIMQITAPTNATAAVTRAEEPAPEPETAAERAPLAAPDEAPVQTGPTIPPETAPDMVEPDLVEPDVVDPDEAEPDTMPAAGLAASEEPAVHEQTDHPETVVLPSPESVPKAPLAASTAIERPRADNDTGPLDDAAPLDEAAPLDAAAPPPVPTAAGHPAPMDHPEPSPRRNLPTEALRPSRLSALNQASEEAIQGAFDAWRDSRTLEPLLVRPGPDERNVFEVIVGIERWHAARRAHIRELPVLVHDASDEDAIRLAMSARLKRGPLSPLAEAGIYLSLMSEADMSTEQVARMVGKPPAHVATMVRVLNLPRSV
ncbi:MAG: ParB/RepB/Spo0J family partition protein, partial [Bauldia litoralis]